ncbi:uncharacterized protein K02A2.6-like [Acropora millepora]|uniref:uncharacterized protein K02A2.6-like n=1 Tax=Acropora millepora TaxID=45264 RepID=UPI001CF39258|nr:uncharacterized protein K02A2.6-like [Acropora millepora]
MSNLPRCLWINLSINFCGPLPSGQYLMVITYEYSRFPIVAVVGCTAAEQLIRVMDKVFCTYGYPDVNTGNSLPFNSQVCKGFLKTCGIKHRKITPLWPKANGKVENFHKPLMKAIRSKDPRAELDRWYATVSVSIPLHSSYHHTVYSIPFWKQIGCVSICYSNKYAFVVANRLCEY